MTEASGVSDEMLIQIAEANRSEVLASLSFTAAEIAGTIGFTALFRLCRAFGGGPFYVPASDEPGTTLARTIGIDAVARLREKFGDRMSVEAPSLNAVRSKITRLLVRKMLSDGLPKNEIARRLGISARYVHRLAAGFAAAASEDSGKPEDTPRVSPDRGVAAASATPLQHPFRNRSTGGL